MMSQRHNDNTLYWLYLRFKNIYILNFKLKYYEFIYVYFYESGQTKMIYYFDNYILF